MLARDTADDVDPQHLRDSVQVSIPIERFLNYRKASELCDGNIDTLRYQTNAYYSVLEAFVC